jgi:hypothetical protein
MKKLTCALLMSIFIMTPALPFAFAAESGGPEATAEVSAAVKIDPAKAAGELKKIFQDMLADHNAGNADKVKAAINGLKLADYEKWFAGTFDADAAKGLTAEYEEMLAAFEQEFGKLLEKVVKGGETEVLVYMSVPGGLMSEATGLQKDAIAAMKTPCPLFTVKFVKPGERSGVSVWSIIYRNGSFSFVGKMRKVK